MANERYHPLVAADLRDACQYYDAISLPLGDRFRMNVRKKIAKIVEQPESHGFIGGCYRDRVG